MARNTTASGRLDPRAARRAFSLGFLAEALSELRRVTWPSREEIFRLTLIVISVAASVGVFLGLIDLVFARMFDSVLDSNWPGFLTGG